MATEKKAAVAAAAATLAPAEESKELPVAVAPSDTAMVTATDMEADAGGGFEDTNKDSYAIPFLQILQKGSPQIDVDHPKFKPVPGAVVGGLYNSVTEEVYSQPEGLRIYPCHYLQTFVEWVPRNQGGGIVAVHNAVEGARLMATTTRVEEEGKSHDRLPNGNDLVDTRSHYVLVERPDGSVYPAVMNMSITQTKKSKKWMSAMNDAKQKREDGSMYTPATWSRAYRAKTEVESKGQNTWRGWNISPERTADGQPVHPSARVYAQAKAFHVAVRAGVVKTAEPAEEPVEGGDIPF